MRKKIFLFFTALILISFLLSCGKKGKEILLVYDLLDDFGVAEIQEETKKIDFKTESAQKFFLRGWSGVEKGGTWATSLTSELRFYTFFPEKNQKVVIRCYPFSYSGSPQQSLKLFLNGEFISSHKLMKNMNEYPFFLPGDSLKKGENILRFEFNYARSPAEVLGKKDVRNLAVRFESLYFPDKKVSVKNIFKKEKTIYFTPACQINYFYRLPGEARLLFDLDFERPALSKTVKELKLYLFISQDNKGEEEKIFETPLDSMPPGKTSLDIDLSRFEEKIVRLSFRFDFPERVKESDLASLYAKLTRPMISGKKGENPQEPRFSKLPEEWKGLEKTNVIIAILDALNPGHMGCYGYERETTPFIDRIAAEGYLFSRAYAQASWTVPSTTSLFTSTFPLTHRVWSRERRLSDEAFTLAEALKEKGFKTCALTSNASASSVYNLFQGFDEKIELYEWERGELESRKKLNVIWAEDFVRPAEEWMRKNKDNQFFMYIHLLQPHTPYNPPPPFKNIFTEEYEGFLKNKSPLAPRAYEERRLSPKDIDYIEAMYDANIRYVDFYLDKILEILRKLKIYEKSIIIITSDHGEAFLEHGLFGHSHNLYEEEIRIPLIIRLPKEYGLAGKKSSAIVQSVDVMPTLLDIYRQKKGWENLQGRSILPLLYSEKKEVNEFIISSLGKPFEEEETRSDALTGKKFKFLIKGSEKLLFNLESDAGEQNNIYSERPILAGYYEQMLSRIKNDYMARKELALKGKFILDKATRKHLKALGYIK